MATETEPVRAGDGLGRRAVRGATVTVAGQAARVLIQLVSVVVLARLLSPRDYGLFAMAMAVAGLAEVFRDFGLSQAAVQARDLNRDQRDALFWVNSAIGFTLAGLVFLGSWAIAAFFDAPSLVPVAQLTAVVFFLNGIATQYRASLARSLRFSALVVIDLASTIVGLVVAILLGVLGFGVWALVAQLLSQSLAVLIVAAALCRWLPGWPRRAAGVGRLLRFGSHIVAAQIMTYLGNNADTITIGIAFGAVPLGIYNRAYQLVMNIANRLRAPITNVAIPVLSRLQDARSRYWEFARIGQTALGYTIVPALAVATGAATPLTVLLLGPTWIAAAPVLSLLAASAALQTLGYFGYWVYVSKGITAALFRFNLVSVAIKVALLVIGAFWGISGVAMGYLISMVLTWPLSLAWIGRSIEGVPIRMFTTGFLRMGLIAATAVAASYLGSQWSADLGPWIQASLAVLAALCVYAAGMLLPPVRRDVHDLAVAASMLRRRQV